MERGYPQRPVLASSTRLQQGAHHRGVVIPCGPAKSREPKDSVVVYVCLAGHERARKCAHLARTSLLRGEHHAVQVAEAAIIITGHSVGLYEQVHVYTGDRKNQHFCAGSRAYVCCCCLQLLRCLLLLLLRSPRGHIAIPVHVYVHTVIPWYTYVYSYTMVVLEYSSTAYSVHVYVHGTRAIAIVWANRCTARQFRAIRRLFFSTVVPFALATSLSREAFTLRSTLYYVYTTVLKQTYHIVNR